jgi:hypothetical protein
MPQALGIGRFLVPHLGVTMSVGRSARACPTGRDGRHDRPARGTRAESDATPTRRADFRGFRVRWTHRQPAARALDGRPGRWRRLHEVEGRAYSSSAFSHTGSKPHGLGSSSSGCPHLFTIRTLVQGRQSTERGARPCSSSQTRGVELPALHAGAHLRVLRHRGHEFPLGGFSAVPNFPARPLLAHLHCPPLRPRPLLLTNEMSAWF